MRSIGQRFVYPNLGFLDLWCFRIAGPGLGNILITWARAVVLAHKNNLPIIEPTWLNFKPGSILRRERDMRSYHNLFLCHNSEYIKGLKKVYVLLFANKIPEKVWCNNARKTRKREVVVCRGIEGMFDPLIPYRKIVIQKLKQIVRRENEPQGTNEEFIGVHIRRGDFSEPKDGVLESGKINYRIPIEWYIDRVTILRKYIGNLPVKVFSDGTDQELKNVLRMEKVEKISGVSALQEMLMLSRSKILIGSGSTFSLWAAYIGAMPSIWYPGQYHADFSKMDEFKGAWETGIGEPLPVEVMKSKTV